MPKACLLLVEDEDNLGSTLQEYLNTQGHNCHWARDCQNARKQFAKFWPEVVLMDIGLPDGNGLDLAEEFYQSGRHTTILFLSALNDPHLRVRGLELGAQDYITKPFALRELLLRLDRILLHRRNGPGASAKTDLVEHGKLKIWFSRYQVQDGNGQVWDLGRRPMGILQALYRRSGQAVEREELIRELWGDHKYPTNRTVDNYIVTLRKWCETDRQRPIEIQSIRGVGYKLMIHPPNTKGEIHGTV